MDDRTFKILIEGANKFGINIDMFHVEQFKKYFDLLSDWNKKMNLTAITDVYDVITKHFLDSLSVYMCGKLKGKEKIIDVGTGAGFPAVPLKIVFPDLKVTLLDSLKKRTIFLNEVVDKLNLKDVEVIHGRAEDLGKDVNHREKYDLCTSRAVASLNILLEYTMPFVKVEGYFVALKGHNVDEEVKNAGNALYELKAIINDIIEVMIPDTDIIHKLLVIKKIDTLSLKYPRKPNAINKMPL